MCLITWKLTPSAQRQMSMSSPDCLILLSPDKMLVLWSLQSITSLLTLVPLSWSPAESLPCNDHSEASCQHTGAVMPTLTMMVTENSCWSVDTIIF